MANNKKYIVYETYLFGKNYYNNALQAIPDYQISDKIPEVSEQAKNILLERNPNLVAELVK